MNNWIITKLKHSGVRVTQTRKQLAMFLSDFDGLFCVSDMLSRFSDFDKVSLYRTIELFVQQEIIYPAQHVDGHQLYEVSPPTDHHHHICCEGCKKTVCVPCSFSGKAVEGFFEIHHSLSLRGRCSACHS